MSKLDLFKKDGVVPVTSNRGAISEKKNFILKPQYDKLRRIFKEGVNDIRFLPRFATSSESEFFKRIEVVNLGSKQYVDPSTLGRQVDSICKKFHSALKNHEDPNIKALIKTQDNPDGISTWAKSMFIGYGIQVQPTPDAGEEMGLYVMSANDGSYGSQGIGYRIAELTTKVGDDPSDPDTLGKPLYGDISNMDSGRLVKIERSGQGRGTNYQVEARPRQDIPLETRLSALPPTWEQNFVDLTDVIHIPSEEELIAAIKAYINGVNGMGGEELFNLVLPEYATDGNTVSDTAANVATEDVVIPGAVEETVAVTPTATVAASTSKFGNPADGMTNDSLMSLFEDFRSGDENKKQGVIDFVKAALPATEETVIDTFKRILTPEDNALFGL